MTVSLSSGQKVHITEVWTHGLEKKFSIALLPTGHTGASAESIFAAYEAVFPNVIEKIEGKDGPVPFSPGWLEGLPEEDYLLIRDAVDSIKKLPEQGKKELLDGVRAKLFSKIGNDVPLPLEYIEYRLCREFHCLPEDLDRIPKVTIELWLQFMGIEAEAARIRAHAK